MTYIDDSILDSVSVQGDAFCVKQAFHKNII